MGYGGAFLLVAGTEEHEHAGYALAELRKILAGDGDVVDDGVFVFEYVFGGAAGQCRQAPP